MIYTSYIVTELGIIEIRATSRKLLSVLFVEEENENVTENEITRRCAKELLEYFEGKRKEFDISLEIDGSEFQKLVWNEILKIPYGTVTTYKEIARRIGRENSVRAVGNIIGKNPILIMVPCHRIVGSNGKMTGYVAGIEKKEMLLKLEQDNS
ncbi:MAG: methylated-DNA--[protein]-cysteine S-methyltransferase [Clostridia bacterium]|nr:methylated-DNA--[protein]-cysteine S-methyltransferase [Clostridia bacterium]